MEFKKDSIFVWLYLWFFSLSIEEGLDREVKYDDKYSHTIKGEMPKAFCPFARGVIYAVVSAILNAPLFIICLCFNTFRSEGYKFPAIAQYFISMSIYGIVIIGCNHKSYEFSLFDSVFIFLPLVLLAIGITLAIILGGLAICMYISDKWKDMKYDKRRAKIAKITQGFPEQEEKQPGFISALWTSFHDKICPIITIVD